MHCLRQPAHAWIVGDDSAINKSLIDRKVCWRRARPQDHVDRRLLGIRIEAGVVMEEFCLPHTRLHIRRRKLVLAVQLERGENYAFGKIAKRYISDGLKKC